MSRILLVIGLASSKSAAVPELVYLGRSGEAMRSAIASAAQPRLLIVPHVVGIPKNNPRAAANAQSDKAIDDQLAALAADNEAAFERVVDERDDLQRKLTLAEEEIATLKSQRSGQPAAEPAPTLPDLPATSAEPDAQRSRRRSS